MVSDVFDLCSYLEKRRLNTLGEVGEYNLHFQYCIVGLELAFAEKISIRCIITLYKEFPCTVQHKMAINELYRNGNFGPEWEIASPTIETQLFLSGMYYYHCKHV